MANIFLPNTKGYVLRCSNCYKTDWMIAVLPQECGAKIAKIHCNHCKRDYAIDTQGNIGGWVSGKQEIVKPLKEAING